ncbi:MAG: hypothetical protein ACE5JX_18375 [Acidobacteriota bacterium]
MRATIELPDHLRAAVLAVAARKGYRGYSKVIVEALEFYLAEKEARESGLNELLALRGKWSEGEAGEVRERISQARENWRE